MLVASTIIVMKGTSCGVAKRKCPFSYRRLWPYYCNGKTTVDTKVHRLYRRARSNANALPETATKVDDGGGARSKFKRLHEDIQNS
jgi:hypothetical protein